MNRESHLLRITDFAARSRLAGMFGDTRPVVAGGRMSYGPTLRDMFRRAAAMYVLGGAG